MDKNFPSKNDSTNPSLIDLLRKYTSRTEERDTVRKEDPRINRPPQQQSNVQTTNLNEDRMNLDYKAKWEESEAKYRALEKKHQQLQNSTVKQLQNKIDQLQRDSNQLKIVKERIAEVCSCRQLTNIQIDQLKLLVNNDFPTEIIANKNDFHQQTLKLRDIIVKHNDELLNKFQVMIQGKRKRNQFENDLSDDNNDN